jgi:hypothetical protein
MRIASIAVMLISLALGSAADEFVWQNVEKIPDDLMTTQDAWSNVRFNEFGGSLRIAAEDIAVPGRTTIRAIEYWTFAIGNPRVVAADVYFYEYDNGLPGRLVAARPNLPVTQSDTGWENPNFGTLWSNTAEVGVNLPCGRWFLGFRTVIVYDGESKYGSLTTRWANGDARALWNFRVFEDGTVGDRWYAMREFNGVRDQEWSFVLRGQTCPADLNGDGRVGQTDLDTLLSCYNAGDCGDVDCDGDTDQSDLAALLAAYGTGCG